MSDGATMAVATQGLSLERGITRDGFLKAGGLAILVAALPGGKHTLSLLGENVRVAAHLQSGTYFPHLGSTFRIRQRGARPLDVKLTKITGLGGAGFALLFRGPRRVGFEQEQGLTVIHPALGRFPLGLVPVGRTKKGQNYEAIVHRPGG
jgi:Domain of unknown function (DUF6916)